MSSTINPALPLKNSKLLSEVMRANFLAAATDINNILSCFKGSTAPLNPSLYQSWMDTSAFPLLIKMYDGAVWVPVGAFDPIAHTYTPSGLPAPRRETLVPGSGPGTFTPGASSFTTTNDYGTLANFEVHFDASYQGPDQFVSYVNRVAALASPLPDGILKIFIDGGVVQVLGVPPTQSVGVAQLASDVVAYFSKVADLAAPTGTTIIGTKLTGIAAAVSRLASDKFMDRISVKDFGAIGDGTSHPLSEKFSTLAMAQVAYPFVTALTQQIDYAAITGAMLYLANKALPNNGGIASIPAGFYITEPLTLPARVYLSGDGINSTVVQLKPGVIGDLLTIPTTSIFVGVNGMTLDGNKAGGSVGNVINTVDGPGSGLGPYQLSDKSATGAASYKYCVLRDFAAVNGKLSGLRVGQGDYATVVQSAFLTLNDLHGLENRSTDNFFTEIYAEKNGVCGIYNVGASNKFSNIKSIWNGKIDPSFGSVYSSADFCNFTAIEAQDNYTHGFNLNSGKDCTFLGLWADTNGYNAAYTGSSRSAYGIIVGALTRCTVQGKVGGYRGVMADGYYATESPYLISRSAQLAANTIDITYDKTKVNTPPVVQLPGTKSSNQIVCKRNATVVYNSTTFGVDVPAIVPTVGLYIDADDTIEIIGDVLGGTSRSFVLEIQPTSIPSISTVIARSTSNALSLTYIPPSLTSNGLHAFDVSMSIGGVAYHNYVYVPVLDVVAGVIFRVEASWSIAGTVAYLDASVSYTDHTSVPTVQTDSRTYTVALGALFDAVRSLTLNYSSATAIVGIITVLSIWSDSTKIVLANPVGSGIGQYSSAAGIYADFTAYTYTVREYCVSALPAASVFYRGQKLTLFGGSGADDQTYICIKNSSNVYVWQALTPASSIDIHAASGVNRQLTYSTGGSVRWIERADNTAESGSNAGTNYNLLRRDDTGAFLGTSIFINRATGDMTCNDGRFFVAGTWQKPLFMGAYSVWVNATNGKMYKKLGNPTTDTDGVIVGTES